MIFFGSTFTPQERTFNFGTVKGITLGEAGHGCTSCFLPTPKQAGRHLIGLRRDLTIGTSNSGRPRINHKKEPKLSLILSSRPGHEYDDHRNVRCTIAAPACQHINLLGFGLSGKDSTTRWEEVLLQVDPGDVFEVNIQSESRHDRTFFLVGKNEVITAYDARTAEDTYRGLLKALELPRNRWQWHWNIIDNHPA